MAKSLWDRIKDLFKTESEKAQDRQNSINDALENERNIIEQLDALYKEYKDSLPKEEEPDIEALFPSDLGLKEIKYNVDSDEDIAARAERENAQKKQLNANKLESKYETQKSVYDDSREAAGQSLKEGYEKLQNLYDDLRKRTENDVLKRGLARSSIATTQLGNLDEAHIAGAGELQASYNSAMANIDDRLASLEADKNDALAELDIKYALELEQRIAELKSERDKTVKEYEEYNNKVRKQNAEYSSKRQSDIEEYLAKREQDKAEEKQKQEEYESKYGYSGDKQENYAKRYQIASDFYFALDPEIAYDAFLASPNMKYYLGAYYSKLLNALKATKVDTYSSSQRYF